MSRSRGLLGTSLVAATVVLSTVPALASPARHEGRAPRPRTVAVPATSPHEYEVTEIGIVAEAGGIVAFPRYAWSMPHLTPVAQRVDPKTGTASSEIELPIYSTMEARDGRALWLEVQTSETEVELRRYDSRTGEQLASITTGASTELHSGFGSLWSVGVDAVVRRIDSTTNTVAKEYPTTGEDVNVGLTTSAVWVFSTPKQLFRIDPKTGKQTDESELLALVPDAVLGLGATDGRVLLSTGAAIYILDPERGRITGIVRAPDDSLFDGYNMVPSGPNRFWANLAPKENGGFPTLPRGQPNPSVRIVNIDAAQPAVVGFVNGPFPQDLSTVGDELWFSALREPRIFHVQPKNASDDQP